MTDVTTTIRWPIIHNGDVNLILQCKDCGKHFTVVAHEVTETKLEIIPLREHIETHCAQCVEVQKEAASDK